MGNNPGTWIEKVIKDFINHSPENTFGHGWDEKVWGDPAVGFSRGDDPLYEEFKRHIGAFHWTPLEIFNRTFPELQVSAGELTVISWILPHTEATKSDNRKETRLPSERWAKARTYGEAVNNKLRRHLVSALEAAGHPAVGPMLSPIYERRKSENWGTASTWSERHAAYASGLGTFGLCDGLITPVGKAMRCGSVVARIQVPPTERSYTDRHAHCLFYSQGTCVACIGRCPAGAISEAGHDKVKCENYTHQICFEYVKSRFGIKDFPCGLCQTGVPCESGIP